MEVIAHVILSLINLVRAILILVKNIVNVIGTVLLSLAPVIHKLIRLVVVTVLILARFVYHIRFPVLLRVVGELRIVVTVLIVE